MEYGLAKRVILEHVKLFYKVSSEWNDKIGCFRQLGREIVTRAVAVKNRKRWISSSLLIWQSLTMLSGMSKFWTVDVSVISYLPSLPLYFLLFILSIYFPPSFPFSSPPSNLVPLYHCLYPQAFWYFVMILGLGKSQRLPAVLWASRFAGIPRYVPPCWAYFVIFLLPHTCCVFVESIILSIVFVSKWLLFSFLRFSLVGFLFYWFRRYWATLSCFSTIYICTSYFWVTYMYTFMFWSSLPYLLAFVCASPELCP